MPTRHGMEYGVIMALQHQGKELSASLGFKQISESESLL